MNLAEKLVMRPIGALVSSARRSPRHRGQPGSRFSLPDEPQRAGDVCEQLGGKKKKKKKKKKICGEHSLPAHAGAVMRANSALILIAETGEKAQPRVEE